MYRKKNREIQEEEVKISLEKLVPENHILRAIDKAIDFSFIIGYSLTEPVAHFSTFEKNYNRDMWTPPPFSSTRRI